MKTKTITGKIGKEKVAVKVHKITVEVSEVHFRLLSVLCDTWCETVEDVIAKLINHAQQGVYRPGAWERMWLTQAFGDDWTEKLVPGDPYGQSGVESIFQKPKEGQ